MRLFAKLLFALTAATLALPASAEGLPDLAGRNVLVVTEMPTRPCSSSIPNRANRSAGNMTR